MDPISVLPNPSLTAKGPFSEKFLSLGLTRFQDVCTHVKAMPYGPNSDNQDSRILFAEGRGTCTTKHGAIGHLAQELGLPVYKNLGFYRLEDSVVTGISPILAPYSLSFIPQIHCFLEYETYRVDLTEGNCSGKNKTIEDYDFVVRVQPDLTHDQHQNYYLEYLAKYRSLAPKLRELSDTQVLGLLERCDRQTKYQCSIRTLAPTRQA